MVLEMFMPEISQQHGKTLGLEGLVQHKYIKRKFQPDLENLKSFIEKLNDQDFQIELQSINHFIHV